MNVREKSEICLKLYEIQVSLFHKRVEVEWKIYVAFLTALVVATGYLAPVVDINLTLIIIYVLTGVLYLLIWLYGLWRANEIDKRWFFVYRSCAEKYVDIQKKEIEFPNTKEFFKDWSIIGQIVITELLLFVSLWIIHVVK